MVFLTKMPAKVALAAALVFGMIILGCSNPTGGDTTPPVLSAGSVTGLSTTAGATATLTFSSDEAGTYYYLVLPKDETTPTAATVKSGKYGTGDAEAAVNTISASGLGAGSKNTAYIVVQDASNNFSEVLTIPYVNPISAAQEADLSIKNTAALKTAGEITASVPKADGSGTVDVGIAVDSNGTVTLSLGEAPPISGEITATTIILAEVGKDNENVILGYIINEGGTLTITGGLDQISGAGLAPGPVTSDENPSLVPPPPTHVNSITLSQKALELMVGETRTLTTVIEPPEATNQAVTWTSKSPAVATVANNGAVSAVSAGTAIITVKTTDGGKTDTVTVTVTGRTLKETTLVEIFTMHGSHKADVINIINSLKKQTYGEFYASFGENAEEVLGGSFEKSLGLLYTDAAGKNPVTKTTPLTATTKVYAPPEVFPTSSGKTVTITGLSGYAGKRLYVSIHDNLYSDDHHIAQGQVDLNGDSADVQLYLRDPSTSLENGDYGITVSIYEQSSGSFVYDCSGTKTLTDGKTTIALNSFPEESVTRSSGKTVIINGLNSYNGKRLFLNFSGSANGWGEAEITSGSATVKLNVDGRVTDLDINASYHLELDIHSAGPSSYYRAYLQNSTLKGPISLSQFTERTDDGPSSGEWDDSRSGTGSGGSGSGGSGGSDPDEDLPITFSGTISFTSSGSYDPSAGNDLSIHVFWDENCTDGIYGSSRGFQSSGAVWDASTIDIAAGTTVWFGVVVHIFHDSRDPIVPTHVSRTVQSAVTYYPDIAINGITIP